MDEVKSDLRKKVRSFLTNGFSPNFGKLEDGFKKDSTWQRLKELGSELWLDTGSIEDADKLWTREFTALTTNNTLLNREIQTGRYDALVSDIDKMLSEFELTQEQRMLEIAFVLNAWHALRLVEKFDAYVSVEEHTNLAHDVDLAVDYAKRYYEICPERFIIKIPFTPAGLLVTRKLSAEGIGVNHTLGFSARQNYVIARIAKPAYINVFLGRLNSFVVNNNLGDGIYIGEKATLASQAAVKRLRDAGQSKTRQIAASFRTGKQVQDLAGVDVMTMPPKVASQFKDLNLTSEQIVDKTGCDYEPGIAKEVDRESVRLNTLWDIKDKLITCLDVLEKEDIDSFSSDDIVNFFAEHDCSDVLVRWSDSQIKTSTEEGKIPKLENWKDALGNKKIGLDSLMNLAGLNSFIIDQEAMDNRVHSVLEKA